PRCQASSSPFTCVPNCAAPTPNLCDSLCVDTQTDPKNCGKCGYDCSSLPNVKKGATSPAVQCVRGACVIQPSACVSGFGHCTIDPNDGCETDLTRPSTCGSCTMTCAPPLGLCTTMGGVAKCSSSCTAPTPDLCSSKCVDTKSDPKNCNSCGHACGSLPHVQPQAPTQCSGGACVVPPSSCVPGFAHCTANPDDGCETSTTTTSNCGGCGVTCNVCFSLTVGGQPRGQCPAVWDSTASVWDGPLVLWGN